MTKELYEKLLPYEGKLYTAYYNDFVRIDQKAKEELSVLHTEAFGHGGKILGGCNRCVINALKNLGREFFAFRAKMFAEEKKEAEAMKAKIAEAVAARKAAEEAKAEEAKAEQVDKEPEPEAENIENKVVTKPKAKKATTTTKKSK